MCRPKVWGRIKHEQAADREWVGRTPPPTPGGPSHTHTHTLIPQLRLAVLRSASFKSPSRTIVVNFQCGQKNIRPLEIFVVVLFLFFFQKKWLSSVSGFMSCPRKEERRGEWAEEPRSAGPLYWLEADFKQRPIKTEPWKNTAGGGGGGRGGGCTVQSERADDFTADVGTFPPPFCQTALGLTLAERWENFPRSSSCKVTTGSGDPKKPGNRAQVLAEGTEEILDL